MRYYNCYVDGVNKLLTYSSSKDLEIGRVVELPFRGSIKLGLVIEETKKPSFAALEIKNSFSHTELVPLVRWMISYYLLNESSFSLILPKEIYKKRERYYPKKDIECFKNRESLTKETLAKYIDIKDALERGDISKEEFFEGIKPTKESVEQKISNISLSSKQEEIYESILKSDKKLFLLRAVTGSGKSEIYAKLALDAISSGQSIIILLPEIALANEIAKKIESRVGEVSIVHSSKNINKELLSMMEEKPSVVVGTRSAIFVPLKSVKYIVIDEEHESSFKQNSFPLYDARAVAMKRALLFGSKLVMGSATPSLERYFYAKRGDIELLELDSRYMDYEMPKVEILDMKGAKLLHKKLERELQETISKGEQALVIINRRGFSPSIQCKSCGVVENCESCSVSLTYFKKESLLKCSYCGFEKRFSKKCSSCNLETMDVLGRGSEYLEDELEALFPGKVIRFDGDINRKRGASEEIFSQFKDNKKSIMVGTRLIAKGLDFPNVTLVAIIDSDSALHMPDFRAAEKTFQLIKQAAGRAGRAGKSSKVFIQTRTPDHYAISSNSYIDFYKEEISFREAVGYPPFSRIINILIKDKSDEKAQKKANRVYLSLKRAKSDVYPPNRAVINKINNEYRYHIFCRYSKNTIEALKNIKDISVDVDPIEFM